MTFFSDPSSVRRESGDGGFTFVIVVRPGQVQSACPSAGQRSSRRGTMQRWRRWRVPMAILQVPPRAVSPVLLHEIPVPVIYKQYPV